MTEAQSHAEIQKILREELDDLRRLLNARFEEIARLTAQLEASEAARQDNPEPLIDALKRRHAIELSLLHILYSSQQNGLPEGVPAIERQVETLLKSKLFDADWYLKQYPDLAEAGVSPENHYARSGGYEGRNPGPAFDTMAYYLANPDVAASGWPALVHYELYGRQEKRPLG